MIAYPDTSILCAMYRQQENSGRAASHFAEMPEPLYLASPLIFEFRQATRWQVFLHSHNTSKGFDRNTATAALGKLQSNISTGAVVIVPVDWADVVGIAERLSAQYTWTQGYRGFDVIHIATALHLGVSEFLTFDAKQKQLAQSEGLILPL
ncbi:MAG: type II toxin-antitoxin system VapC family toxin [Blastochloris sp.]|nr:type II toxin-antitoxin system VapC family toxin [Blastochloris sp.]